MYLKRLEIGGFKSFAVKTVLDLEPGITAIVGPNGSGKSNIADAIRWSLGEQSGKQLRLKKSHELVFAGTEKKARAGLAEVNLLLDNSDGKAELDFSEVELSRRLYRSGETEYLLNRSKVRLNEVQQLLASAGFGTNSYAVIGQGVIDNFVLSSPAERKLLFDEAAGIHQHEIKREQSLRKLEATKDNLARVKDILAELAPRLATLARQVEAARQRQDVAARLDQARAELLTTARENFSQATLELDQQVASLQGEIKTTKTNILQLEKQQQQLARTFEQRENEKAGTAEQLQQLETKRDQLVSELGVKRAEVHLLIERSDSTSSLAKSMDQTEAEQTDAKKQLDLAQNDLKQAKKAEAEAQKVMDEAAADISAAQVKLSKLRRESDPADRQAFIDHALAVLKLAAQELSDGEVDQERLRLLVHKAGRLLSNAAKGQTESLAELRQMQLQLNQLLKRRDVAHDAYTKAVIKVRSLELDIAHLTTQLEGLKKRQTEIAERLAEEALPQDALKKRQADLAKDEQKLAQIDKTLAELRNSSHGDQTSTNSQTIFALASELEALRSLLNQNTASLNAAHKQQAELKADQHRYDRLAIDWFGGKVPAAKSSDSVGSLEREVDLLESKLEAYGEADKELLEEYDEVQKRHDFLSSQVGDLEIAQADMAKVVAQLEQLIRQKFETGFAKIADHFSKYFQQLFGGGNAALVLNNEDGQFGIDIQATPPGKKVESLSMLSGGERSLTGIALLAAILTANPSPFVVMDEVDAALDEANSARFAAILKDIAKHSQLIVITHNRQTMQAAHSLFGVTMDEHHVSRLLSVRLEQARELASKP